METLGQLSAAIAFFGVGIAMVLYELSRTKAGNPILKGSPAIQLYYMTYLTMFVLSLLAAIKAII